MVTISVVTGWSSRRSRSQVVLLPTHTEPPTPTSTAGPPPGCEALPDRVGDRCVARGVHRRIVRESGRRAGGTDANRSGARSARRPAGRTEQGESGTDHQSRAVVGENGRDADRDRCRNARGARSVGPDACRRGGAADEPACATSRGSTGCRALSVSAVLLYHADVTWMPGGFLGVDVFFAISGYLITSLLLAEYRNRGGRERRPVLPAPGPPAAARAVPRARDRLAVRGDLPARRGPLAPRRRRRRARLRDELVADLPAPVVRRGAGSTAAAAPPVVARGRGAVLPGVAADALRDAADLEGPAHADAPRDARHLRRVLRARCSCCRSRTTTPSPTRPACTTAATRASTRCCSARRSRWCGRRGSSRRRSPASPD